MEGQHDHPAYNAYYYSLPNSSGPYSIVTHLAQFAPLTYPLVHYLTQVALIPN